MPVLKNYLLGTFNNKTEALNYARSRGVTVLPYDNYLYINASGQLKRIQNNIEYDVGGGGTHSHANLTKLDEGQETYVEKLTALIDQAKINTLTVLIMQVPCCAGLLHLAQQAAGRAKRKVPIKSVVVGIQGGILKDEWVTV
jgi:hypothetical protein